jgi:hypothetical protein
MVLTAWCWLGGRETAGKGSRERKQEKEEAWGGGKSARDAASWGILRLCGVAPLVCGLSRLSAASACPACLPCPPALPAEKEKDAPLNAILDHVVGLGTEQGWTQKLANRLQKLAAKHGVDLSHVSDDEEGEGQGQGAAAASSGGHVWQLPCRAVWGALLGWRPPVAGAAGPETPLPGDIC